MPAVRPSVVHLIPLLLVTSCVDAQAPAGPASPATLDDIDSTGRTGGPLWSTAPDHRLPTAARAFHPRAGDFVAQQLAFEATLQADGIQLQRRSEAPESAVWLSVHAWGRDLEPMPLAPTVAEAGSCTPTLRDDGNCIRRIERAHPGLDEWWVARASGIEFGFDLYERPEGNAPIVVALSVDGAEVETDGDTAWLTDTLGGLWTISGTVAWDADGELLDIFLEAEDGDRLLLVVDDTHARWPITIDPVISTADTILSDGVVGNRHGHAVADVGDINGDDFDDVVVGAPNGTEAVYVYYGSSSGLADSPDHTIVSPIGGTDDDWGGDVAAAGDINNDGFMDVIVGARLADSQDGAAYVYLGTTTGLSTSTATELSEGTAGQYGYSVSSAGDVNSDGFDDVIVGAPLDSGGSVYVYHGSVSGIATSPSTTIRAGADSARQGADVASAGDVDGDGYDDIIIGDPDSTGFAGQFHIHHGSDDGVGNAADTTITATVSASFLGSTVDGVGDVDGDGYDDVVVGAVGDSSTVQCYAEVYQGSSSGLSTAPATTLEDTLGSSCGVAAGAGDVNGDTFADIIVGSPTAGPSNIGAASIYLGSPGGLQASAESTVVGTAVDEMLGYTVGSAGDVNGDGFDDMLVASFDTDEVQVFHGSATDVVADGFTSDVDCDDTTALVNPSRAEQPGDEIDSNCDGLELCYADLDGDGFTDGTVVSSDIDCSGVGEATSPTNTADCDDDNASIFPGATELVGDQIDSDCDNRELCYADADGDTYTDGLVSSADLDCNDSGETSIISTLTDCDDNEATTYPGAPELPGDEVDSDCDGGEICYEDLDGDTFTTGLLPSADVDCDDSGEASSESAELDCDDTDASINPAATELVGDEVDSDCDDAEICYADADEDGYTRGIVGSNDVDCDDSGESTTESAQLDCDDDNSAINPAATEIVGDEVDSDCDTTEICYADADEDGYTGGTVVSADINCRSAGESTAATAALDCDDNEATTYPGAPEGVADGVDSDCDAGEICYADADDDGFTSGTVESPDNLDCTDTGEAAAPTALEDCDDSVATVNPAAVEVVGNDTDDDCDGTSACWADNDNDGYIDGSTTTLSFDTDCSDPGEAATGAPTGECNDNDPTIFPGATEFTGDGVDSDCNGAEICYADADADGYADLDGTTVDSIDEDCDDLGEADLGAPRTDCNDASAAAYPGADEVCDGIDNSCDGNIDPDTALDVHTWYADADGDGFGDATATVGSCTMPSGFTTDTSDCDDAASDVYPGADELCDEVDNDCDGVIDPADATDATIWYPDSDEDGYGDSSGGVTACEAPIGHVEQGGDCDDRNNLVYPTAEEWANDGVDQDCNGDDKIEDGTHGGGCATVTSRGSLGLLALLGGMLGLRRRRS